MNTTGKGEWWHGYRVAIFAVQSELTNIANELPDNDLAQSVLELIKNYVEQNAGYEAQLAYVRRQCPQYRRKQLRVIDGKKETGPTPQDN